MPQHIILQSEPPVLTIQLNRPDVLNALNNALMLELVEALEAADADDALSAVAVAFEYFDGVSWGGLGSTTADQGSIPWTPPCVSNWPQPA